HRARLMALHARTNSGFSVVGQHFARDSGCGRNADFIRHECAVSESVLSCAGGTAMNSLVQSQRAVGDGRHGDANAFTLIELLVVCVIIAVLTALLLPALIKSTSSAQRVKCVSNLRQLGLAAQMYWDDNGGHAFRYRGVATNGGDLYWFGWLARGSEGARAFDPTAGALFPYLSGRGVEICPALNYALQQFKRKATGAAYGYGYNLYLSAPSDQPPGSISKLTRPTEIAVLADAAQVNTWQPPASAGNPLLEEWYYVDDNA